MYERLIEYYHRCGDISKDSIGPIWGHITNTYQKAIKSALANRDCAGLKMAISSMASSGELHGIEDKAGIMVGSDSFNNYMLEIGRRVGIVPIFNPEQPSPTGNWEVKYLDGVKNEIESMLGFPISVPDCFGFNQDVDVIPHRFMIYCAAAFAIRSLFKGNYPKRIMEIGAGIGNLGHMAYQWNSKSYTVIDLPTVSVLSAYFISRSCGESNVWLWGEPENKSAFARFYPSTNFKDCELGKMDLVFNSDSFPEMPGSVQQSYLDLICGCISGGGLFLSINHESDKADQIRVNLAVKTHGRMKLFSRCPFMMRQGYIEEIYYV